MSGVVVDCNPNSKQSKEQGKKKKESLQDMQTRQTSHEALRNDDTNNYNSINKTKRKSRD